jgi:hypothetical protein
VLLGNDPKRVAEDSILELAGRGHMVQAIRLASGFYGIDLKQAKEFVEGLIR